MNSLGRILFILVIPFMLFAKVSIDAPSSFYKGDDVIFTITAEGSAVKFPLISKIGDFAVQSGGSSSSTSNINGIKSQSISKSFILRPSKTVTIPSFEIVIDGKVEKTEPRKIIAKDVQKTSSSLYSLDIGADRKTAFVGEGIVFTIKFRYKKDLQIMDLQFMRPAFESFWVKELRSEPKKSDGDYFEYTLNYLLFPQKGGKVDIGPLKMGLVLLDPNSRGYGFFGSTMTKKVPVYSNAVSLDIKPLPEGVGLIGDFKIQAQTDKKSVKEGEALSYTLKIDGRGNLDDIGEIKLDIPNATIYDNPAKKEFDIKEGKYGGTYTKTYSIISGDDFTIPPIELRYFNKNANKIETVKTDSFNILVEKKETVQKPKLQVMEDKETKNSVKEEGKPAKPLSNKEKGIYFILGLVFGALLSFLAVYFINREKKTEEKPFEKNIKTAKTKEELFKLLVVYINIDDQLDKIIFNMEKSTNEDIKSLKKDILRLVKDKKLEL